MHIKAEIFSDLEGLAKREGRGVYATLDAVLDAYVYDCTFARHNAMVSAPHYLFNRGQVRKANPWSTGHRKYLVRERESVQLKEQHHDWLERKSKEWNISPSHLLMDALRRYVEVGRYGRD